MARLLMNLQFFMESIIETFHLDVKLLVAQIINFAVVLAVLYWLVFKPLLKTMEERSKKVAKSLVDAKKIEEQLALTQADYQKEIVQAKKEASLILEQARARADETKKEMIVRVKEEIGLMVNQQKAKLEQEKAVVLKEIRQDVAGLVIKTVEKVLNKKLDEKGDQELIKNLIKEQK